MGLSVWMMHFSSDLVVPGLCRLPPPLPLFPHARLLPAEPARPYFCAQHVTWDLRCKTQPCWASWSRCYRCLAGDVTRGWGWDSSAGMAEMRQPARSRDEVSDVLPHQTGLPLLSDRNFFPIRQSCCPIRQGFSTSPSDRAAVPIRLSRTGGE